MIVSQEESSNAAVPDASDIASLRTEIAQLRARLEAFEQILQIRDASSGTPPREAALPAALPLPQAYEIAADQLLPVHDGFYQLEWGPEGAFRWTGPHPEVHFEAWVDRSEPLIATIRLFHFGTPANAKELTIEVDGAVYAFTRQANEKILRSAPIAPRAGDGPTRITLKVPHIHSPSDRGLPDKRILGVAFQRLRLERA